MKPEAPLNFTSFCMNLSVFMKVLFSVLTSQISLHDCSVANNNLYTIT